MDKRFFLALLLTAIVIVVPPLFLNRGARRPATTADSASRTSPRLDSTAAVAPNASTAASTPPSTAAPSAAGSAAMPTAPVETTTVHTRRSRYGFSSQGAAPISVVLDSYPSRRPTSGDPKATRREMREPSELLPPRASLARYRLALGRDTIALDTVPLRAEVKESPTGTTVSYTGTVGGYPLALDYAVVPDSFLLRVNASVTGAPVGSAL